MEIDKGKELNLQVLQNMVHEEYRGMLKTSTASFKLCGNDYVPITDENKLDNSRARCEVVLEESREQPQRIGKVKEHLTMKDLAELAYQNDDLKDTVEAPVKERETLISGLSIDYEMINRIWLHDGKIYLLCRNDYDYEQVRLLILDYTDRQKKRFESLGKKFKKK